MKNKAHSRSVKQKLSVLAFIALYLITPFLTNLTAQSAFAAESIPVPLSDTVGNEYDENGLLSPGAANTDRTVPTSPYEHPTMSLIEQETRSRNSLASQEVNRNLNNEFANYNETYTGLNKFWDDTIVGKFFNNFLPWIGKNVSEFLYSWIPSAVQYLARALEIFVLNPNIAVNGLANDPRMTITNTPAAQEGQTYINAIAPEVRKLADIMYGIAVDLLLLLFVLCIWKYWADASWGRGGSNLMGAVGRLITTSALMLAWPTIYAFWIQISNEMIKAIYFNSANEMVAFDQAMATVIKAGLWAVGGLLLNAIAPVAGSALGGLVGGPLGGLVGGTIGGFVAFAGLIIFMVFGAILIAQLVYLVTLKSIQTILLTAQYMFAPIFIVMFATPDTEDACAGFVRSFVEVSLWSFVWVGFLRLLVVIMNSDFSPWGKVVLGLGILQLMISVPAFIARAQISPMSDFLSAGMITGGLVKGAAAIGNTANTFAGYWADHRNKAHTVGGAQGAQKSVSANLNPQTGAQLKPSTQSKLDAALNTGKNGEQLELPLQGGKMNTPPPGKTPDPNGPGGPKGNKGGPTAANTPPTGAAKEPTQMAFDFDGKGANKEQTQLGFDFSKTDEQNKAQQQKQQQANAQQGEKAQAIPGATTGTSTTGTATGTATGTTTGAGPTATAAGTTANAASSAATNPAPQSSLSAIKEAMKQSFKPGAINAHTSLAQFLGGMWARAAANSARDLSSPIIGDDNESALIGSVGGGVGLTKMQRTPSYDANGNRIATVDDVAGAQMLAASGIVAQGAKNEIFSDKMRQAAIAAGYDKPKGIGDRMASGIMMGLSGKHWSNTAAAKQAFQHGMFKEGAKGALAWVQNKPGNAVTDHLNATLGECTEDAQVDLLSGIMDPENINSGFKSEAVNARMRVANLGLPWNTDNNVAGASPATKTVTQAEALPAFKGTASLISKMVRSEYPNALPAQIAGYSSKAGAALTPGHGKAVTQIMIKYGNLDRTGSDKEDAALVCNAVDIVQDVYGPNARPNQYLETYDSLVAARGLPTESPKIDNGSNAPVLQKLNISQETINGHYSNNMAANQASGGTHLVKMMAQAGVRGPVMSKPQAVQVAAQINHNDIEQVRAFGAVANESPDNISLQRVHAVKEYMAYDSNNNTPDTLNQSRIDLIEAVVHLEATSNNPAYDKGPVFHNTLMQQVSRSPYRPSATLPKGGYDQEVVKIVKEWAPRAEGGEKPAFGKLRKNNGLDTSGKEIDDILDHHKQHDLFEDNSGN